MNLPAADSIGLTSIFDVLAPPAAALFDDAPSELSFDAVLNKPTSRPTSCPLPDWQARREPHKPQEQRSAGDVSPATGEGMSETTDASASAHESVSASEETGSREEPSTHEEDESDGTAATVIVPAVVLGALPAAGQVDETAQVETAQVETEPETEPDDGVVLQSLPISAASMQPNQPIRAAAVVPSPHEAAIDGEAATILVTSPPSSQAVTHGTNAIEVEPIELETSPATDSTESGPAIAVKRRTSSDKGDESGRDSDQAFRERSAIHGELAVAVEPVVTGTAEPKGIETPAAVATRVETVPPATTPSSTTPHQQQPAPRLLPELLSAATGRATHNADAPQVDSMRLLNRVARAFVAAQDGSGEVRLRLSPPELGALRLEVRVLDGTLIARLETETTAARTALIDNLPALRERLAEQGIRIERFDVDLMQRQSGGAFDRPAHQQPQDQSPLPPVPVRPRRLPQVAEGVVARATIVGLDQRRLNVVV